MLLYLENDPSGIASGSHQLQAKNWTKVFSLTFQNIKTLNVESIDFSKSWER